MRHYVRHVRPYVRVGRMQSDLPVLVSRRGGVRYPIGVPPSAVERAQDRGVVPDVVEIGDEHEEPGMQMPRVLVVERQLGDLPRTAHPEGGRGDVQVGQFPGREGFQPDVELVGDGDLPRLDEGIADHRDVAARGGAFGGGGFAVEEAQAAGLRDGPEIEVVRPAHFRVGFPDDPHAGDESPGEVPLEERRREPKPGFAGEPDQREPRREQRHVPADQAQRPAEVTKG